VQATCGQLGVENERLRSQVEDAQLRYQTLLNTAGARSLKSFPAADGNRNREEVGESRNNRFREAYVAHMYPPPPLELRDGVAVQEKDEGAEEHVRYRAAYASLQQKILLLQAEGEHELTRRLEVCCCLVCVCMCVCVCVCVPRCVPRCVCVTLHTHTPWHTHTHTHTHTGVQLSSNSGHTGRSILAVPTNNLRGRGGLGSERKPQKSLQ
jgi:hypothetical protein